MAKNRAEDTAAIDLDNNQTNDGSNNQMKIMGIIALVVFLIAAYFIYKIAYKEPRANEAMANITQAQMQFERDSFQLALNNPGNDMPGFLDIIEDYSGTPTANTSRFYAGVSYLNMEDYTNAISHLEAYKPVNPLMTASSKSALADAYSENGDMTKAASLYEAAASASNTDVLTILILKKLGMLHESQGNKEGAIKAFTRIKNEFPTSQDGKTMDKYLARLK